MTNGDLLLRCSKLGDSRAKRAERIAASEYAPGPLSPSAFGMWYTRAAVPFRWRMAVMDVLGLISAEKAPAPELPRAPASQVAAE